MSHLYVIAVLVSLRLTDDWGDGVLPAGVSPLARVALVLIPYAVLAVIAAVLNARCVRRLDRRGDPSAVLASARVLFMTRLLGLLWHLATVPFLGVLGLARLLVGDLVFIDELLAAGPAFALLLFTYRLAHPIERRVRAAMMMNDIDGARPLYAFPGPREYVVSVARNNIAIMFVPLALILAWSGALDAAVGATNLPGRLGLEGDAAVLAVSALQIAGALAIFAAIPVIMVRVWDTTPIPPGPLRDGLERLARAHKVRVSGFLVWRTGGAMLNAAVIGITPLSRYIVLTDALLEALPEPEVEAVAAHEVAHVRNRHMVWLAVAILGSAMVSAELFALAVLAVGLPASLANIPAAVASLAAVLLVLGAVSRRFERQADAFAARHLSEVEQHAPVITHEAASAMSGALARVSRLNGMPQDRFTWRHGSIAARRQHLQSIVGIPVRTLPIDRRVRTVLWLSAVVFFAGLVLTAASTLNLGPYALP